MAKRTLVRRVVTVLAGMAAVILAIAPAHALEVPKSLIAEDFPDPDIVKVGNTWYAYATNNYRHVPVASAPTIDGPWTVRGDAMPGGPSPSWAQAGATWAPDVHANPDGSLTMTYTARHAASGRQCIGVATASSALGPFTPVGGGPLICPLSQGGAIDANTFVAANGTRYLLWKNDGNAVGQTSTLWLSQTTSNGTALVGGATALITTPAGTVIEAPDLVQRGSSFALVYSAGGYGGCGYSTYYSSAPSLNGPWATGQVLMTQGNSGICGPGGGDVVTAADGLTGGDKFVFHGWVNGARHMYSIDLSWSGTTPVQGGKRASSLDGDMRSEIAYVEASGDVRAWHNDGGFLAGPYGDSRVIASGYDPARLRFADLDDDGKAEMIHIQVDGQIRAFHNDGGFAASPFGQSHVIAAGFADPSRVRFADLDDDGRAELIQFQSNGDVWAWHNDGAFSASPYGNSVVIATGFTPERTNFADLDADGRAEITLVQPNGDVWAWHNDGGFSSSPYGMSVVVADGFTDPSRLRFADLDDDGRAEVAIILAGGDVRAWHNDGGFAVRPYGSSVVIAGGFTDPSRTFFI
ncbi:family 43 glycosylhydrolase [Mumia zhuanghuii]|uniref:Family 43 glycosylhydrolase n=2 Tax=Mumia TaxID=1546255 RepID=A0ABW1QLC7_9ACTN|nr:MULTISPECIES: family 43 glycosylhydrolase [Mumia]KAA1418298.1 family 43 glycosylhydrolase [Mumia zhuanghuii]